MDRIAALAALLLLIIGTPLEAQSAKTVPNRDDITARLAELRRIHTPEGIEALEEVTVGRTRQWLSIRGRNRANPVLLFIHGGPGSPMMPLTWAYQSPWEDFFTVVQWDQRGIGKNAATTDRTALAPTLKTDQIVADAEEVAAYIRKRLGKEKIVVMGYSYGCWVGIALAHRRPEWLHAYVGVGQQGDGGEDYLYQRLIELATRSGNQEALRELQSIAPYSGPTRNMKNILLVRKWARAFNGGWYGKSKLDLLFALPEWSPDYTQADLDAHASAAPWFSRTVMANGRSADAAQGGNPYKIPVIVIMGRYDLHTPYQPSKAAFERIVAPHKRFITLERSAHVPMMEEPGLFLLTLVQEVLPLTEGRAVFKTLP